jgi:hypothetical protein
MSKVPTLAFFVFVFAGASAPAQTVPWEVFLDTQSGSTCDLINANNAQLVLVSSTSQLAIVTGIDVTLQDTFVDEIGLVFFEDEPVGTIDFATDGDGFRTLWWTSLTGTVVNVNGFTGQPTQTNNLPTDFEDVGCDACDLWDNPATCADPPDDEEPPVTVDDLTADLAGSVCGPGDLVSNSDHMEGFGDE